jgi:hypothetical protein
MIFWYNTCHNPIFDHFILIIIIIILFIEKDKKNGDNDEKTSKMK